MKKAIVLLSGGLDSTTTLYYALDKGYDCQALIFDYGQRHRREIKSAKTVARHTKVPFHVLRIKLPWKGSSLLDKAKKVPTKGVGKVIPSTYVPGRNIIFLSFALSFAESHDAEAIFIGAHTVDYSGYPDCRPEFFRAFQQVINKGTKVSDRVKIIAPLLKMNKAQIIKLGRKLGAPLDQTWSCYQGGVKPCGVCDSCRIRERGLQGAN